MRKKSQIQRIAKNIPLNGKIVTYNRYIYQLYKLYIYMLANLHNSCIQLSILFFIHFLTTYNDFIKFVMLCNQSYQQRHVQILHQIQYHTLQQHIRTLIKCLILQQKQNIKQYTISCGQEQLLVGNHQLLQLVQCINPIKPYSKCGMNSQKRLNLLIQTTQTLKPICFKQKVQTNVIPEKQQIFFSCAHSQTQFHIFSETMLHSQENC
eukprot:TRINITY_DN4382_c1_g1_i3.p1 TRINITY_DN4382_c1_g1~~TRINITY_DN4382_c1_g1_i3.p1  ORF type:complete len:208 (-),score=-26.03 TRINITY_DN4382_c1_g1_i3:799-1422(-)